MWTVWLLASSWAPLAGMVMALADPPYERQTFLGSMAANWGIVPSFLLRIGVTYAAARKAFAAGVRWRAVAWFAAGGVALVVMFAGCVPVGSDLTKSQEWEKWEELIKPPMALAAVFYGVLAASLCQPGKRISHERRDFGIVLAGLWIAAPVIATHFALANVWQSDPAYPACLPLVRTTRILFGHGDWFVTSFGPSALGLGDWIQGRSHYGVLLGLQLVLAFLPVAVAVVSLLRIIARRRWVHLVENGRILGWGLRDATVAWPTGIPVLTGDGRGPVKVLARMRDTADPYRAAEADPVALVASSPRTAHRVRAHARP
jgi:hypothetical protein